MKRLLRFPLAKPSSFTLVELLVVIAIIAILAGTTLTISSNVIKAAKKAKAANTATQIQTAVLGYYTEYSVYPVPSGTSSDLVIADSGSTAEASWGNLIFALCGNLNPANPTSPLGSPTVANSRGIAFLNLKASDVDAAIAPLNPLPTPVNATTTNNAFFNIAINSSYSGVMGTNAPTSTAMPNFTATPFSSTTGGGTSTAGVAVWANCNASTTLNSPLQWVHTY